MSVAMEIDIHPTAIVSSDAKIGANVRIGPGAIIDGNVVIGENCDIGAYVYVADGARLGKNIRAYQGAIIGSHPQDLKFAGEDTALVVGDNCIIREYVTLNRGTVDRGTTEVGKNCLFMAYAHVAHDCVVGDNVIMANSVNLGGHAVVEDFAIVGGMVPVHQFTHIGKHVIIGGGFRVVQDVVPYAMAGGNPLRIAGMNKIGLKRRKFPAETIKTIDQAFRILFFRKMLITDAVKKIQEELPQIPEIKEIVSFISRSKRGLATARKH